jgi:hypothetical protein
MRGAIAANPSEMNSMFDAPDTPLLNVVASLIGSLEDAKALAAVLQHLEHERHSVKLAVLVESRQNLFATTDFNQFAGDKVQAIRGIPMRHF